VKPTTFCSLGRTTFDLGKEQGEHILVQKQEQGFISEGIFARSTPQRRTTLEKMAYKVQVD